MPESVQTLRDAPDRESVAGHKNPQPPIGDSELDVGTASPHLADYTRSLTPTTPAAKAYRNLRTTLMFMSTADETERRAVERSVDQLRRLDVRIFGVVLHEVSTSAAEDSYYLQYYHQYYHAYEPGTPREAGKAAVAGVWDCSES